MSQTLEYFKEISRYPRPSKQEGKIRDFLISWAQDKDFSHKTDKIGNLIVYVPACGSSSPEPVILQAHIDMVCVKIPGSSHDFLVDPIEIYEDQGFLRARGTSLGADNGVGVALAMAACGFDSHPPLELVFTIDEEAGMTGVENLDFSLLSAKKVINLDSEDEDEICISSAGGIGVTATRKITYSGATDVPKYSLSISGMRGGHSGCEIHENRGNAIVSLVRFLSGCKAVCEVYDIHGGSAHNVIPSSARAIVGVSNRGDCVAELEKYLTEMRQNFDCPDISYSLEEIQSPVLPILWGMDILKDILPIQSGVYSMSSKIEGLVETSMNLGIIRIEDNILEIGYLARSSVNAELFSLSDATKSHYKSRGYEVDNDRGYLGWQDDPDSELLKVAREQIAKVIGKSPKVIAIHAGLECGAMVSGLGEGVNAISIGPNISEVHSVDERGEVASINRMEISLKGILENL